MFSNDQNSQPQTGLMGRFLRDEDGGIIIMTLLLLIVMLVVGGMAVDFMRFESKRALLQSVSDRAVLAAAELDQSLDSRAVVVDFFEKAGFGDTIVGEPLVQDSAGSRYVQVDSEIDVSTFYLRLIGIDELSAPAVSSAVEGTGNIEVSLVLDISGSMGSWVASEGATRMELLQSAASAFVDDLLLPEYRDRISINLVAYSQQVALGEDLYNALKTTPDAMASDGTVGFASAQAHENGFMGNVDPSEMFVNPSRCVDFLPGEFAQLAFNTQRTYQQVERFQHYNSNRPNINLPVCPDQDFEGVVAMSQDADTLKDAIAQLRPTTYTSIHLGMKWGVSLLDPSMRDLLAGVNSIDPEFAGSRPADYDDGGTVKYVILMTDGENVQGRRLRPAFYNSVAWRRTWGEYPMDWWRYNVASPSRSRNALTYYPSTATQQDQWMQSMCGLAKEKMTVFTIAMGASAHGTQQMQQCASQPSYAFQTDLTTGSGDKGIDEIFEAIAQQITALRLSL